MRAAVVVLAAVALSSCSSAGKQAEKEYDIVARNGDAVATCAAGQKVAEAYLKDQNEKQYRKWLQASEGDCATARLLNR